MAGETINAVPPKISRAGWWIPAAVIGVLAAGGLTLLYFVNPAVVPVYPQCQFHEWTGLNCPGCGGTRAMYALLHGRLETALRDNALAVAGLAGLGLRGAWFGVNRLRGRANGTFFPAAWLWPLLVVTVVFGVLRNLPACAFLSP